jgi:hypothetical protein
MQRPSRSPQPSYSLGAFTDIIAPPASPRSSGEDEASHLVKIRHLAGHGPQGPDWLSPQDLQVPGKFPWPGEPLRTGDALVTLRGAEFRVALVPRELEGLGLGAGLACIRILSSGLGEAPFTPLTLRAYLLNVGWRHLQGERSAQGHLSIRLSSLRRLPLSTPLPNLERVQALESLLVAAVEFREAARAAIETRDALTAEMVARLYDPEAL